MVKIISSLTDTSIYAIVYIKESIIVYNVNFEGNCKIVKIIY